MAEHIIEMRPEGANDYGDIVYPVTKANAIIDLDRFGSASGTNAYAVTIGSVPQLYVGLRVTVMFTNANTGASTLNVNGLGAKPIIKANGSGLSSGNIKAGSIQSLVYNGTSFQLVGEGGEYGTATASHVLSGYTVGTDNGLITGTIPVRTNIDTSGSYPKPVKAQYGAGKVWLMPTAGYYNGNVWVEQTEPNLIASNIKSGVVVGSDPTYKLTGTFTGLGNATTSQVLNGNTFSTATLSNATGTMPNRGAVTSSLTTQGGAYTIPAGYHNGAGKVTASFSNLVASNIKKGVSVGGIVGTLEHYGSVFEVHEGYSSRHDTSVSGTTTNGVVVNNSFNASLVVIQYAIGRYGNTPVWSAYYNLTAVKAFASTHFKLQNADANIYEGMLRGTVYANTATIRWNLDRNETQVIYRVVFIR